MDYKQSFPGLAGAFCNRPKTCRLTKLPDDLLTKIFTFLFLDVALLATSSCHTLYDRRKQLIPKEGECARTDDRGLSRLRTLGVWISGIRAYITNRTRPSKFACKIPIHVLVLLRCKEMTGILFAPLTSWPMTTRYWQHLGNVSVFQCHAEYGGWLCRCPGLPDQDGFKHCQSKFGTSYQTRRLALDTYYNRNLTHARKINVKYRYV